MAEDNQFETQQLPLFSMEEEERPVARDPKRLQLSSDASIDQAIGAFEKYMQTRGFTENTQQAFRLDLQLLNDYLGPATTIDEVGTTTLNAFLRWMESGRGIPCSPKTLERRITTLKVFFGWLAEEESLPRDVAAPLIHRAVSAPLPETLTDDEISALLAVTQEMRQGRDESAPDARPHLLLTLLLNTGIKKSECTNIHLNHLDLADAKQPAIWIRYRNARRRHKERRIALPPSWPDVLDEYLSQYPTQQRLFPWTGRNLEYVLTGVAEAARVSHLTFEMLRWTCAVRDYIDGMESDALRRKLGLSEISWYEVENRLDLLARLRAGYSRSDEA
ncbi:MAG: site-specific integrase [Anaerolineae bacterium]|nr:site-specific integrase [Anaerolineae bacterium]